MLSRVAATHWIAVCSALLLAACGGSGGGPGAPVAPPAPPVPAAAPATVLNVSVSQIALAANNPLAVPAPIPGNPRQITVVNTGTEPALSLALGPVVFAGGTSISANTCVGTLAAGASCTITITPGTGATTLSVTLTIQGSNTNTVSTNVDVLAYGSVYQGGVVFAIDDTTFPAGSVGGKAMARTEAAAGAWSPDFAPVGADSLTDGAGNTAAILATYSDAIANPATAVAARACDEYSDAGYADWYLPAICEMGYDQTGAGTGCGSSATPLVQNVQSSLVDGSVVSGVPGTFWSSTQFGGPGTLFAWAHHFELANTFQVADIKGNVSRLLCMRALTP